MPAPTKGITAIPVSDARSINSRMASRVARPCGQDCVDLLGMGISNTRADQLQRPLPALQHSATIRVALRISPSRGRCLDRCRRTGYSESAVDVTTSRPLQPGRGGCRGARPAHGQPRHFRQPRVTRAAVVLAPSPGRANPRGNGITFFTAPAISVPITSSISCKAGTLDPRIPLALPQRIARPRCKDHRRGIAARDFGAQNSDRRARRCAEANLRDLAGDDFADAACVAGSRPSSR